MKEKLKHLRSIQNMMVLAFLVLLIVLTTQTLAIAQDLTRAQIAVILGQGIHGSNFKPPAATGIFDDVSVTDKAADWIEQFYKDGITSGCGQNPLRYCPDIDVNRAAMAVFLLRSKYTENFSPPKATGIFDDVPVTHWAADWIEQLYREKITNGCSTSPLRFCPDSFVTGVQAALFVSRTFGYPPAPVFAKVHWPDPRFTDNGDGTVTDHLTGLIWLEKADCFGQKTQSAAKEVSNKLADGQCGLADGSRPGDWRLPSLKEQSSIIIYFCEGWGDRGDSGCAPASGCYLVVHGGWRDKRGGTVHTSTIAGGRKQPIRDMRTWIVNCNDGSIMTAHETDAHGVLPVRDGN